MATNPPGYQHVAANKDLFHRLNDLSWKSPLITVLTSD